MFVPERPLPAFVWRHMRKAMRINAETMKCVVFIGVETERGGFLPLGTGFIIGYELDPQFQFTFVVTAAHVIENLSDDAKRRVAIRINRLDGKAMSIRPDLARILTHEDPANDVMLIAFQPDPTVQDVIAIAGNRSVVDAMRAELDEGTMPGDTVAAIGLYTSHYGTERNAPVLRTGHVAAVAGEPVYMGTRGYAVAHLIELRTFAGLSGSPVLQTVGPVRIRDGQPQHRNQDTSSGIILGVLVGYHCVEDKDDIIHVPRFGPQDASSGGSDYSADERNTGFGVVIPIERVFEILERDDTQRGFKNSIEIVRNSSAYREAMKRLNS